MMLSYCLSFVTFALATDCIQQDVLFATNKDNTKNHSLLRGHSRQLQTAFTTTKCNAIRVEPYVAQLELVYSYLVEFAAESARSLGAVETAIVHAVADVLDECDAMDRPRFQVQSSRSGHEFSKEEFCAPMQQGDTCHVVTGVTYILVDDKAADVQQMAYDAITNRLSDLVWLSQFAPSVVRAEFQKSIRETLLLSPPQPPNNSTNNGPSSVTTTVAIATASVSFVLASIFCFGLLRKTNMHHPEPHIRHKRHLLQITNSATPSRESSMVVPMGIIKRRQYFERLDDVVIMSPATYATTTVTIPSENPPCGGAWSVSDITSESGSIRSTVSRSTVVLERIEEVDEHDDDDDEDGNSNSKNDNYDKYDTSQGDGIVADAAAGDPESSHPPFLIVKDDDIPHYLIGCGHGTNKQVHRVEEFDVVPQTDLSELHGFQFLDDSTTDYSRSTVESKTTTMDSTNNNIGDIVAIVTADDDEENNDDDETETADCIVNSTTINPQDVIPHVVTDDDSEIVPTATGTSLVKIASPTSSKIQKSFASPSSRTDEGASFYFLSMDQRHQDVEHEGIQQQMDTPAKAELGDLDIDTPESFKTPKITNTGKQGKIDNHHVASTQSYKLQHYASVDGIVASMQSFESLMDGMNDIILRKWFKALFEDISCGQKTKRIGYE